MSRTHLDAVFYQQVAGVASPCAVLGVAGGARAAVGRAQPARGAACPKCGGLEGVQSWGNTTAGHCCACMRLVGLNVSVLLPYLAILQSIVSGMSGSREYKGQDAVNAQYSMQKLGWWAFACETATAGLTPTASMRLERSKLMDWNTPESYKANHVQALARWE